MKLTAIVHHEIKYTNIIYVITVFTYACTSWVNNSLSNVIKHIYMYIYTHTVGKNDAEILSCFCILYKKYTGIEYVFYGTLHTLLWGETFVQL